MRVWRKAYPNVLQECLRRCGADHTAVVREELAAGRPREEALHPWRYAEERKEASIPF